MQVQTFRFTLGQILIQLKSGKQFYAEKYSTGPNGIHAQGSFEDERVVEGHVYFFPNETIEWARYSVNKVEGAKTDNTTKLETAAG